VASRAWGVGLAGERVSIRVVPFGVGAHPGMTGPFILLEFPNPQDDDVLYLEHVDGDKVIRDELAVTGEYTERFFHLEKLALSMDDTRRLLHEIIAELSDGAPKPAASMPAAGKTEVTS
jgi:hypothetical protein